MRDLHKVGTRLAATISRRYRDATSGILLSRFFQISFALFLSKETAEASAQTSFGSQYLGVRLNADPSFIPTEFK